MENYTGGFEKQNVHDYEKKNVRDNFAQVQKNIGNVAVNVTCTVDNTTQSGNYQ